VLGQRGLEKKGGDSHIRSLILLGKRRAGRDTNLGGGFGSIGETNKEVDKC